MLFRSAGVAAGTRPVLTLIAALGAALWFAFARGFFRSFRRIRFGPVDHENFADMLNGRRRKVFADFMQHSVAVGVRVGEDADLDQFVAAEAAVDFLHHRRAQTAIADHDDGVQRMGTGAKFTPLRGIDFKDHDGSGVYQVPVVMMAAAEIVVPLKRLSATP